MNIIPYQVYLLLVSMWINSYDQMNKKGPRFNDGKPLRPP